MAIAFAVSGFAFAALCVWLTVRIVNRRERWAKRTLAVMVALPVLYVASYGPACWYADAHHRSGDRTQFEILVAFYRPLATAAWTNQTCLHILRDYGRSQSPREVSYSDLVIFSAGPGFN